MIRRALCGLLALAILGLDAPAHAASVLIVPPEIDPVESDGQIPFEVRFLRDPNDPPTTCRITGTVTSTDVAAEAGSDYTAVNVAIDLTLGPSDPGVVQPFNVGLIDNAITEPFEDFQLNLAVTQDVSCSAFPLTVDPLSGALILDDDPGAARLEFAQTSLSVNEAAGSASLQISLNGTQTFQPPFLVTVDVATADGTASAGSDYTSVTQSLTFTDTQTTQLVTVPIASDAVIEGDETFTVTLTNAAGEFSSDAPFNVALPAATATVTITEVPPDAGGDETISAMPGTTATTTFLVSGQPPLTVTADNGAVTPSTLSESGSVTYTFDVPATAAGGDTIQDTVTITDGSGLESTKTITIEVIAPADAGGDETISATPGATATTTFFVDGQAPLTLAADSGTLTPSTLSAPGDVTYTFDVPADAAEGDTFTDTITITDGDGLQSTKAITVEVLATATRDITEVQDLNPNQRSLAGFFDTLCPLLDAGAASTPEQLDLAELCTNLRDPDTTNAEVKNALDAINPEEIMATSTSAMRLTNVQHGNLSHRINALRSGASGIDVAGLDVRIKGQRIPGIAIAEILNGLIGGAASADEFARWGLFADGTINFGDKDETENESGFDYDTITVTTGIDYRLRQNLVLGLAIGYASVEADFERDAGSMDVDSYNVSAFGTYYVSNRFYVDGALTYGDNQYESVRKIAYTDAGGAVNRTASGDTDGEQLSLGLATGFDFNRNAWTFGPHVGAYYLDVDIAELREQGAGGLDLIIGKQSAQSFTLNAGAHASVAAKMSWGVLIPHLRVDWVHELEDGRELLTVRLANDPFANDPSNPMPAITLTTDRPDKNYLMWSAGVSAQFINGISGFVNYRSSGGLENFSTNDISFGMRFERSF